MAQAYDFALDKIGMEIMSYQVELNFFLIHTVIHLKLLRKITDILFYFLDLGGLHQFLKRRVSIFIVFDFPCQ